MEDDPVVLIPLLLSCCSAAAIVVGVVLVCFLGFLALCAIAALSTVTLEKDIFLMMAPKVLVLDKSSITDWMNLFINIISAFS